MSLFAVQDAAAESIRMPLDDPENIFADGFESGDTSRWSDAIDVDRFDREPVTDVAVSPTKGAAQVNQLIREAAGAADRARAQSDITGDAVAERAGRQSDQLFDAYDGFRQTVNNQYTQLDQLYAAHKELYGYVNGLDRVSDQNAIDFNRQTDIMAQQVDPMIRQARNMANRATNMGRQLDQLSGSIDKARMAQGPAGYAVDELRQSVRAAKNAFGELQAAAKHQGIALGGRSGDVAGFLDGLERNAGDLESYIQQQDAYLGRGKGFLDQLKNSVRHIQDQARIQQAHFEEARDYFHGSKISSDNNFTPINNPAGIMRAGEHANEDDLCQSLDENWYSFETCDDKCDYRPCLYKGGQGFTACYECPSPDSESCFDYGMIPLLHPFCGPGGFCQQAPEMWCGPPYTFQDKYKQSQTCTFCAMRKDECATKGVSGSGTWYPACEAACANTGGKCMFDGFYQEPDIWGHVDVLSCWRCEPPPPPSTCEDLKWGHTAKADCDANCQAPDMCVQGAFEMRAADEYLHRLARKAGMDPGRAPGGGDNGGPVGPGPESPEGPGGQPGGAPGGTPGEGGQPSGGGGFAPGQGQGTGGRGGQPVPGGESPDPTGEKPKPPAPGEPGSSTGGGATTGGGEAPRPGGTQPGGTETPSGEEAIPTKTDDVPGGEERTPPPEPSRPKPPESVERPQKPAGTKPERPTGVRTENPPQVELKSEPTPTQEAKDPCEGRRSFETPAPDESDVKKNLRTRMLEAARGGAQTFRDFQSSIMDNTSASDEEVAAYGELLTEMKAWSSDPCNGRTRAPGGTSSGSGGEAPRPTKTEPTAPTTEQPRPTQTTSQAPADPCAGKRSFATPAEDESGDKRAMRNRIINSMRDGSDSFRGFIESMIGENSTANEIEKRLFVELIKELQEWAKDPCSNRQREVVTPTRQTPTAPVTGTGTPGEDPCAGKRTFFQAPDNESAGKKAMRTRMITAMRGGADAFRQLQSDVMDGDNSSQDDIQAFGELMQELQAWANDPCNRASRALGGSSSGSGGEAPRPAPTTTPPPSTTPPREGATTSSQAPDPCAGKRAFGTPPAGEDQRKTSLRRRFIRAAQDGGDTFNRFYTRNMQNGDDSTKRWLRELMDEAALMLRDPCFNKNAESQNATASRPRLTEQGTEYLAAGGCANSPGLINKDSCEGYCRYRNRDNDLSTSCIPTLKAPNGEQCYACPGTPEATHPGQPGCYQIGKMTKVSCESICENKCEGDGRAPNTEQCWRCKADATWTEAPAPRQVPQAEEEPKPEERDPYANRRTRDGRVIPTYASRGEELTDEDRAKAAAQLAAMFETGREQGGVADANYGQTREQYNTNISIQEQINAERRREWQKTKEQYAEWERRHQEFLAQPTAYEQFLIDKAAEEQRVDREKDELRSEIGSIQGRMLNEIKEEIKENSDLYDPYILKYISVAAEMQHETQRLEAMAIRGMMIAQMRIKAIDLYMEQHASELEEKPYLKRYLQRMRLRAEMVEIENRLTILETTMLVRVGLLVDVIVFLATMGASAVGKGMMAAEEAAMRASLAAARSQAGKGTAYVVGEVLVPRVGETGAAEAFAAANARFWGTQAAKETGEALGTQAARGALTTGGTELAGRGGREVVEEVGEMLGRESGEALATGGTKEGGEALAREVAEEASEEVVSPGVRDLLENWTLDNDFMLKMNILAKGEAEAMALLMRRGAELGMSKAEMAAFSSLDDFTREIVKRSGGEIVEYAARFGPSEVLTQEVVGLGVRILKGSTKEGDAALLRRLVQQFEQRGLNFFDELARSGTLGDDGFQQLFLKEGVDTMRNFFTRNAGSEAAEGTVRLSANQVQNILNNATVRMTQEQIEAVGRLGVQAAEDGTVRLTQEQMRRFGMEGVEAAADGTIKFTQGQLNQLMSRAGQEVGQATVRMSEQEIAALGRLGLQAAEDGTLMLSREQAAAFAREGLEVAADGTIKLTQGQLNQLMDRAAQEVGEATIRMTQQQLDEIARLAGGAVDDTFRLSESQVGRLLGEATETLSQSQLDQLGKTLSQSQLQQLGETLAGKPAMELAETLTEKQIQELAETLTERQLTELMETVLEGGGRVVADEVAGLGSREALEAMTKKQFVNHLLDNVSRETNETLISRALELGMTRSEIAAASSSGRLLEAVVEKAGGKVVESSFAREILAISTRVFSGNATAADRAALREMVEAAERQGVNFFEDLARSGTASQAEGFQNVLNREAIDVLQNFARSGAMGTAREGAESLTERQAAVLAETLTERQLQQLSEQLATGEGGRLAETLTEAQLREVARNLSGRQVAELAETMTEKQIAELAETLTERQLAEMAETAIERGLAEQLGETLSMSQIEKLGETFSQREIAQLAETLVGKEVPMEFAETLTEKQIAALAETLTEKQMQELAETLIEAGGRELTEDVVGVGSRETLEGMSRKQFINHLYRLSTQEQGQALVNRAVELGAPRAEIIAAMNEGRLLEYVIQKEGLKIVDSSFAREILALSTRVYSGAATSADRAALREMVEAAERQGVNFFEDLARSGTTSALDGFQNVLNKEAVDVLESFVRSGAMGASREGAETLSRRQAAALAETLSERQLQQLSEQLASGEGGRLAETLTETQLRELGKRLSTQQAAELAETLTERQIAELAETMSQRQLAELAETVSERHLAEMAKTAVQQTGGDLGETLSVSQVAALGETFSGQEIVRIAQAAAGKEIPMEFAETLTERQIAALGETLTESQMANLGKTLGNLTVGELSESVAGIGSREALEQMGPRQFLRELSQAAYDDAHRQLYERAEQLGISKAQAFAAAQEGRLVEMIAEKEGLKIVTSEFAREMMAVSTRVFSGNATAADREALRILMNAAEQRGVNFFEELAVSGRASIAEGFQPVLNQQAVEVLEVFAKAGVQQGSGPVVKLTGRQAAQLGETLTAEQMSKLTQQLGTGQATNLGETLTQSQLLAVTQNLTPQQMGYFAETLSMNQLKQAASTMTPAQVAEAAKTLTSREIAELAETLTEKQVRELSETIVEQSVADLGKTLTVQEMAAVSETFSQRQIATLAETLTEAQLKDVTEVIGGQATQSLTEKFTTQELKNIAESLTSQQLERLVQNVGDDTGMAVLEHVTGLGSRQALERMPANRFMMELMAKVEDNAVEALTQAARDSGVPDAVIRAASKTRNPVEELATAVARANQQEIVTSSSARDLMALSTRIMQGTTNEFEEAFVRRAIREAEARGADYFEELGRKVVVSGEEGIEQVLNPDLINQLRQTAVQKGWMTP